MVMTKQLDTITLTSGNGITTIQTLDGFYGWQVSQTIAQMSLWVKGEYALQFYALKGDGTYANLAEDSSAFIQ